MVYRRAALLRAPRDIYSSVTLSLSSDTLSLSHLYRAGLTGAKQL